MFRDGENSVFLISGRFQYYGLPPLPPTSLTLRMSDGDRRSIFDDFENFRFLSKI